ncbi:Poly [ADP-ribose] polymerase 1 [Tupaia chinensis]|uniref:Poly [ADP-ribose] polymerase 1 n=1 Tax=Tupaia chinensis TaxID=246437 RepID=L9JCL4_TUPCH|nr:Poly [ADP-ribose] polymerase 1 [Tupaia chinensis]
MDLAARQRRRGDFAAEYAKFNRSTCKGCVEKIEKGQMRLFKKMSNPEKPRLSMVDCWYHQSYFATNTEELGLGPKYRASQPKHPHCKGQRGPEEAAPEVKSKGWEGDLKGPKDPTHSTRFCVSHD